MITRIKLKDYDCPICGKKAVTTCRCFLAHSTCEDGHKWHLGYKTKYGNVEGDTRIHVLSTEEIKIIDK